MEGLSSLVNIKEANKQIYVYANRLSVNYVITMLPLVTCMSTRKRL